ncbi:hypothetical protein ACFSQQ_11315 [Mesorhizobium kowhaii]|uniref:hypothetical protein n=1 Tax=Mesorhizobium kowhaii TaxID=1300272 RepID=UPI0035ED9EA5
MSERPSTKNDRVREIIVNGRKIWLVRFRHDLFLKKAFDSEAELQEALGADERASATVHVRKDPEAPWSMIEFLLNGEPLYTIYNGTSGKIGTNGTNDLSIANAAAERLNQRSHLNSSL